MVLLSAAWLCVAWVFNFGKQSLMIPVHSFTFLIWHNELIGDMWIWCWNINILFALIFLLYFGFDFMFSHLNIFAYFFLCCLLGRGFCCCLSLHYLILNLQVAFQKILFWWKHSSSNGVTYVSHKWQAREIYQFNFAWPITGRK